MREALLPELHQKKKRKEKKSWPVKEIFFSFVFNLASLNAYNKYINSNVVVKCTQELINNKSFVGEEIEYIMPKPPELDKKKRAFWQKLGGAEVSAELKELYSAIGKEEALFKDIKKQDRELTFGAAMVVYDESKRIWDLAVANNCKELIDISVDLTKEAAYSMVNLKEYGLAAEMFKSRAMDETGYGVITSGIYSLSVDGRHYDAARLAQSYRLDDDVATQYDKCIDRLLDRALWAEAWDVIQEANSGFEYREKIAEIKEELSEKQQKFAVGDSVHTYVDYALQNNKNARFYGPSIKDFYGRIVSFPDIGRAEINGWHVTDNDTTQFKGIVPVDRMKKKKD